MQSLITWLGRLGRLGDKSGAIGAIISTMGCAMCFPAAASIGAAIGLGFLSQWEGVFVNALLPFFAGLALVANVLGWISHRQWHRSLAGVLGPVIVLLSLYPWFQFGWSTWTLYGGLALMLVVAIWDLAAPAHRRCSPDGRDVPEAGREVPEMTRGTGIQTALAPSRERRTS